MKNDRLLDYKRNSINTLRLLAAFQVMWGHMVTHLEVSFPKLGGVNALDEMVSWILYFFHGVPLFFFLSGFLAWVTIERYDSSKRYYCNRFLRIYPELWVGVIIEIICIILFVAPINWKDIILFTGTQATFFQFWTPDSLRSFGCGTPNGSLWTICVMIQFYIIVWPLRKLLKKRKLLFWIVTEIVLIIVGAMTKCIEIFVPQIIYKLYCQVIIQYLWIFWLGIIIAEFKDKFLPVLMKYWYILLLGALAMRFSPIDIWARDYPVILSCLCCVALLGFAYKFPLLNVRTDVSYALFIYHMIVVNIIIEMKLTGSIVAFFAGIIGSFVLAYLSTVLIGRRVGKLRV